MNDGLLKRCVKISSVFLVLFCLIFFSGKVFAAERVEMKVEDIPEGDKLVVQKYLDQNTGNELTIEKKDERGSCSRATNIENYELVKRVAYKVGEKDYEIINYYKYTKCRINLEFIHYKSYEVLHKRLCFGSPGEPLLIGDFDKEHNFKIINRQPLDEQKFDAKEQTLTLKIANKKEAKINIYNEDRSKLLDTMTVTGYDDEVKEIQLKDIQGYSPVDGNKTIKIDFRDYDPDVNIKFKKDIYDIETDLRYDYFGHLGRRYEPKGKDVKWEVYEYEFEDGLDLRVFFYYTIKNNGNVPVKVKINYDLEGGIKFINYEEGELNEDLTGIVEEVEIQPGEQVEQRKRARLNETGDSIYNNLKIKVHSEIIDHEDVVCEKNSPQELNFKISPILGKIDNQSEKYFQIIFKLLILVLFLLVIKNIINDDKKLKQQRKANLASQ